MPNQLMHTLIVCSSLNTTDTLTGGTRVGSWYLLGRYLKLLVLACERGYVCKRVTMPIPLVSMPINVLQQTQGLPSVQQSIFFFILSIRLTACCRIFIYFFAFRVSMDTTDTLNLNLFNITICIYSCT